MKAHIFTPQTTPWFLLHLRLRRARMRPHIYSLFTNSDRVVENIGRRKKWTAKDAAWFWLPVKLVGSTSAAVVAEKCKGVFYFVYFTKKKENKKKLRCWTRLQHHCHSRYAEACERTRNTKLPHKQQQKKTRNSDTWLWLHHILRCIVWIRFRQSTKNTHIFISYRVYCALCTLPCQPRATTPAHTHTRYSYSYEFIPYAIINGSHYIRLNNNQKTCTAYIDGVWPGHQPWRTLVRTEDVCNMCKYAMTILFIFIFITGTSIEYKNYIRTPYMDLVREPPSSPSPIVATTSVHCLPFRIRHSVVLLRTSDGW